MQPKFIEIEAIEPKVVDLTINHDSPMLSVRMPIYKMDASHETQYLELRYTVMNGNASCEFTLSPQLVQRLYESQAALASLPLMHPDQVPIGWSLGLIDNVFVAVKKLKDFHDQGQWRPFLDQYLSR